MATTSRIPDESRQALAGHLEEIYGPTTAPTVLERLVSMLKAHQRRIPSGDDNHLSQSDVFLITYPDQVTRPDEAPLDTLHSFLLRQAVGLIGGVHILPFFPSSSDDGFAVMDYRQVDPRLGTWNDITAIAADFKLMLDGVINHISSQSAWYQGFLHGEARYQDYFITVDPQADLSAVVRPRALPLLAEADTSSGPRHVWTTFSSDQIDLNFDNPDVLLEIVEILLFYVEKGARLIRLDAIAYLCKQIGTPCIHLHRTHQIVKLMRAVLEAVAPKTLLISETNVPHADNVSYFGSGDEAHLVYQFPLPPVVLHSFLKQDASRLSGWARSLEPTPPGTAFFNFLASHDGIGLNPARGILDEAEFDFLVERVKERGGAVSYRSAGSGQRAPYELNINYLDALTPPEEFDGDLQIPVRRFLAAHAIILALQGVPGIYFHSLFGSRNDYAGVERSGAPRSINRQKLDLDGLESELADARSVRRQVFDGLARLLRLRVAHPAFHPFADQQILDLAPWTFGLIRSPAGSDRRVLCLHNVTETGQRLDTRLAHRGENPPIDLLNREPIELADVRLGPHQVRWIEFRPPRDVHR